MRTRYKPWAKPYLDDHQEIVIKSLDDDPSFFADGPLEMEIGCGKGDFIVALATNNPNTKYLAIEVSAMVAAMAARKAVENKLQNIRFIVDDVAKILPLFLDETLGAIYLNFSDPWPKKKHEKRRLTFPAKLLEYTRILKKGGYLIFKSDNDALYNYSLSTIKESPLELIAYTDNYSALVEGDAMSEYEKQFRSLSKNINRIVARRK